MKTKLLLFVSVLFLFISCEENLTTDVNTNLKKDVNVPANEDGRKSGNMAFSVTDTLSFADNKDLEGHINSLKEMSINETTLTLDIPVGDTVDLTVNLPQAGFTKTYNDLIKGSPISLDAADIAKLNAATDKILKEEQIILIVSGNVTNPIAFGILFDFYVTVTLGL
jgi:hypothetical protein